MINNNLPQRFTNSFFYKIKLFFINMFKKKKSALEEKVIERENDKLKDDLKQNVVENIQKQEIDNMSTRKIADRYASDPELLANLSLEKLEKINNYYLELIKQLTEKVKDVC